MNNTSKKLFFALITLTSMTTLQARFIELTPELYPLCKLKQAKVQTKEVATQTEAEPEDTTEITRVTPSPSRLRTMLAFMKMPLQTRQKVLNFFTHPSIWHESKNAASLVIGLGSDALKAAIKNVLKSKAEAKIKGMLGW